MSTDSPAELPDSTSSSKGDSEMPTTLSDGSMEHWKEDLYEGRARSRDGANYAVEAIRLGFQEGKVGYRESLAIKTVGQPEQTK